MNIQISMQQFCSEFNYSIANIVTGKTFQKLEKIRQRSNESIFEIKKFERFNISKKLYDKIKGFSLLKSNWDTYDADLISVKAIDTAFDILEFLNGEEQLTNHLNVEVFPMRDGGVQFEFDGENICAELEISQTGTQTFILYDVESNIDKVVQLFELSELLTLLEDAQYA